MMTMMILQISVSALSYMSTRIIKQWCYLRHRYLKVIILWFTFVHLCFPRLFGTGLRTVQMSLLGYKDNPPLNCQVFIIDWLHMLDRKIFGLQVIKLNNIGREFKLNKLLSCAFLKSLQSMQKSSLIWWITLQKVPKGKLQYGHFR